MALVHCNIPLSSFHDPEAAMMLPPIDLLRPIQDELLVVARSMANDDEQVTPSRLSSLSGDLGEAGVYVRKGDHRGAVVHVLWAKRAPAELEIKVSPLSRVQVVLSWTALGVSMALGVVLTTLLSGKPDGLTLFVGLLVGVAVGVAVMLMIVKRGIGSSPESRTIAERLSTAVDAWRVTKVASGAGEQ